MLYQLSYLATPGAKTACGAHNYIKLDPMDATTRRMFWDQFGAAIDMLENAICACPPNVWNNNPRGHEFWYVAFHTLFFLDYYTSPSARDFAPPDPFTLSELDPEGEMPDRIYSKDDLLRYLDYGRKKAKASVDELASDAGHALRFGSLDMTRLEWTLYSMRHVQHHAAQLNLLLRQQTDQAPRWVARCT